MSNIDINHLNSRASIHNKIKDAMKTTMQNQAEFFFLSRSFIIIWDCCCCIEANICWKLCICSCCCLVCSSKIFIISWSYFLDWFSRLPSTSTRCFCSWNSSSFHFWRRKFSRAYYANVSLPLLRLFCCGFAFSSSSFGCLFCILPKLSRALFLIFTALALAISSRAFSTSLKSHSIPYLFIFHLCFK